MSKYGGMTVGERLFNAGLIETFDSAAKAKDWEGMIAILLDQTGPVPTAACQSGPGNLLSHFALFACRDYGYAMEKVKEYHRRAEECRQLASMSPPELKPHYQELAVIWDRMAAERLTFFVPPEEVEADGQDQDPPVNRPSA